MQEKNAYVVHEQNATFIATEYNKTHATIKYLALPGRTEKMATQAVSYRQFESIIPDLLLNKGFKVEVYVKDSKADTWTLAKKVRDWTRK